MAVECNNPRQPKIEFAVLLEYLATRSDRVDHMIQRSHRRMADWYQAPGPTPTKAIRAAEYISEAEIGLALADQRFHLGQLFAHAAISFLVDYSRNLTRLDGSRKGPVGLWSNAFAIVDCLSAGRFNNAQILRDQAVQLLNQRAYKAQELYAEDLELQKDPENYVEIIPQRLFVFAHELMGQRAGQEKQPWEIWDIVGDQDYIKAARAVYTEDMDEAAQTLCQLCNLHVQYSNPFPADDENDHLIGFEFDTPIRAIWPTEIFAWLRLRQERGLPLPEVEHPLLDQPLGRFEPNIPTQWEYKPWFVELVQKLVAYHPRYADLPRMVFEQP